MKYAIIAAGEGSRLAQEGIKQPKPLVEVNGIPLIDRLIGIFLDNDADEIVVIVNNEVEATKQHLYELEKRVDKLRLIVQTTPSSMHSFYALSPYLKDDKFCLTTVDTIFREEAFRRYIQAFRSSDADGMMAVTDYIDDEKPLYITTDEQLTITGFHDERPVDCRYISGGIYCLTPKAIDTLERCMGQGLSRMRNFQRQLVADGLHLTAYPFEKIVDVDHAEDVRKAEAFLQGKE